ncbi:MAG: hypothetical protein U9R16_06130, partial [Campylobacterota bacterium]|nr:hypothetical protein [Campylobacterota bacterium]
MNINFSSMIKQLILFFVVISTAYLLNSVLYFILPKSGIEFEKQQNITLEYNKFNIKSLFEDKQVIKVIKEEKQEYKLLSNITLKAVYSINEQKAWIIIASRSDQTYMLSIGESYKGYELIKVHFNYAIFRKSNQEYKLELIKDKDKVSYTIEQVSTNTPENDERIIVMNDKVSVQRAYLNSYINNFDKIWKDISIKEIKNVNGDIDGFKVTKIKPKSVFIKLGLKKGDVIKSINNIMLRSYNDAFSVYKKINKIKNL